MEVETRVSVQAMRGRFEQLHEESPLASSPTQKMNTSPVRTRASSVINKDGSSNEEGKKPQGKLAYPTEASEHDQKHLGRVSNIPSQETPNSGLFLSGIASPVQPSSKIIRASTARKYSIDSIRGRREHAEIQTPEKYSHGLLTKSAGEKLDICGAELKPSVVKRIPVFKSVETGLNSEGTKYTTEAEEEAIADSQGKRGRLFGHIRSRSHGNFIIKRDSSVEKNNHTDSVTKQKENVLNKDWLSHKRKQKGNDNVYNNQDSKSNSSFEGKQKIVANVVKNMKNKEKPKVLRKLSFSSKTEKELKNKKVKAVNSSKDRHFSPSLPPANKVNRADNLKGKLEANTRFMKADEHTLVKDKRSPNTQKTSHISGAAVATVAIAKAVADVAIKKSEKAISNSDENFSSPCSEDTLAVPPERPPRRRSSVAGLPLRKKGKAPSPPDHSSISPIALNKVEYEMLGVKKCTSDEELYSLSIPGIENYLEHKMSPDVITSRHNESPDLCKSSESLLSSQSLEKSRENSPIMINQVSSPILSKRSLRGYSALCKTPNEQRDKVCEEKSKIFKSELQSVQLENNKETTKEQQCVRNCTEVSESTACLDDEGSKDTMLESTVNSEIECLPIGPPPRKPPRTFAYDIYRNVKVSKSDEEHGEKETGDSNENSQSETSHVQPIYAVPIKKKNAKKCIAKPPIRSKSDLTNKDILKPSIAPKPAHILTKAKRASVVDPLSSIEKDEEAAITSEFQRQAHIRYSLRRPKKPPPVPPPYPEMEGNAISDSGISSSIANTSTKSHTDISCFTNNQRNQHEDIHNTKNAWDSNSNTQEFSEHEHSSSESLNLRRRLQSNCFSPDLSNYEDLKPSVPTVPLTSHSTHNLRTSSPSLENDQPLSLGYCFVDTTSPEMTDLYKKRSMSDETLYKGSRHGDEPIYATPIFTNSKGSSSHNRQRELHYMEADAGRDGTECERKKRRNSTHGKEMKLGTDAVDGNKGRSSLISAWKKEFRQSCRQVQNKIKKTVIR